MDFVSTSVVVVCFVAAIVFVWIKIESVLCNRRRKEIDRVSEAVFNANKQILEEAVRTLASAEIFYNHPYLSFPNRPNCFKLPKGFWSQGNVSFKAEALITLVRYDEKNTYKSCAQLDLAELLAKQATKTPGVALAIACKMADLTDRRSLQIFHNRLIFC